MYMWDFGWPAASAGPGPLRLRGGPDDPPMLSLYKILLHFKALLWESIILLLPPPTCKAYPLAILLHGHCTIYAPLPTPPFVCHTPYNMVDGNIV